MANMDKFLTKVVSIFDTSIQQATHNPKASKSLFSKLFTTAGDKLLAINTFSMVLAALTNTAAAAVDKNTSKEDKKFLVPAGLATGVANIGIYFTMTRKIIKSLENKADKVVKNMAPKNLDQKALEYVNKVITKAENAKVFKKSPEAIKDMRSYLLANPNVKDILKDGKLTQQAFNEYSYSVKEAASVFGSFIGVVVGCGIIATIIRDVSAYFVQKHLEEKNPSYKDAPYRPYFDPGHFKVGYASTKQPLNLNTYMAFTRAKSVDGIKV